MIERTANKCYVTIYTSRPGFVIGKKGSDIDKIKNNLSKFTKNEVTLNIKEVKKPETNAYLVAENIALNLSNKEIVALLKDDNLFIKIIFLIIFLVIFYVLLRLLNNESRDRVSDVLIPLKNQKFAMNAHITHFIRETLRH